MNVAFDGIGQVVATFEAESTAAVGKAVKITGNGKVGACSAEGDIPAGVVVSLRDGYAAVQVRGYVELPCAAGVTAGYAAVSIDAAGKVQADAEGRAVLVAFADTTAGLCGLFL